MALFFLLINLLSRGIRSLSEVSRRVGRILGPQPSADIRAATLMAERAIAFSAEIDLGRPAAPVPWQELPVVPGARPGIAVYQVVVEWQYLGGAGRRLAALEVEAAAPITVGELQRLAGQAWVESIAGEHLDEFDFFGVTGVPWAYRG